MAASKSSKEIVETVGPLKAELEELRHIVSEVSATLRVDSGAVIGAVKAMVSINNRNVEELDKAKAELAEARRIIAEQSREVSAARSAQSLDVSESVYREALADFAVRVLSGGVAVSFHEARP